MTQCASSFLRLLLHCSPGGPHRFARILRTPSASPMEYNPVELEAKTGYGTTCEPLFTSLSSVQIPWLDFLLRQLVFIGVIGVQTSEGSLSFPSWLERSNFGPLSGRLGVQISDGSSACSSWLRLRRAMAFLRLVSVVWRNFEQPRQQ